MFQQDWPGTEWWLGKDVNKVRGQTQVRLQTKEAGMIRAFSGNRVFFNEVELNGLFSLFHSVVLLIITITI